MKTLNKMTLQGKHHNLIKAIFDKTSVNILLNVEKAKAYHLSSGTSQGCALSPLLLNTVLLEAPARAFRQEKETKSNHFGNVKLYLPRVIDDRILYVGTLGTPSKNC